MSPVLPSLRYGILVAIIGFVEILSADIRAQPAGFQHRFIAGGISNPTAMAIAPDGRIFVCQQNGLLRIIKAGALLPLEALSLTVDPTGERGLLGVAFDPSFPTDPFVYLYYTVPGNPPHNRVSKFTVSGDIVLPNTETILLELDNLSGATNHNGGTLAFGPDGKLYIAVGDNANGANSQTLTNLLGKILRINEDGTIPPNPFSATTTGKNQAIWALGLRNPFSFAFQPGTGKLFINDVGQSTFEEINLGVAGSNYGWPTCEGPCNPPNASFRDPIYYYGRGSSAHVGCAITSGAFYNPVVNVLPTQFVGKYFFVDFCTGWIDYIDPLAPPPAGNSITFGAVVTGFPVSLLVAPNGNMFYTSRGGSGEVWTIEAGGTPGNGGPLSLGNLDVANCTTISGWAADPVQPNSPINVDIVSDGQVVATLLADGYRPDVQAAGYGDGRKGFSFTVPASLKNGVSHSIVVRTTGLNRVLYSTPKTILCGSSSGTGGPSSIGNLDVANCSVISGWAADPAQPNAPINVDILSDGQVITTILANIFRPDVQAAGYGDGNKGFSFTVPDALKNNQVHSITARVSGPNIALYSGPKAIACGSVIPGQGGPSSIGNLDTANCSVISGWAADPAQPNAPISVDILSDGQVITAILANVFRPDVQAAGYGNGQKGFSFAVPAALKNGQPHLIVVRTTGLGILLYSNSTTITCN